MNGIEIEIRQSNKIRSKSFSRLNDYERKHKVEEKIRTSSHSHWDYSTLYGKNIFPIKILDFLLC